MILVEAAVTTLDEARAAVAAGADRLELCIDLEVGGVTPPFELFEAIRDSVTVPVCVLVRPRAGDFSYSTSEFDVLKRDAERFLSHGAAAIVVGVLKWNGTVDATRNAELAALAPGAAVFHRAFDEVTDRLTALETIITLGFRRILTSGGATTALEGAEELATLIHTANGRIEILPGGGVNPEHAVELIHRTGCTQLHGSFRGGGHTTEPNSIRTLKSRLSAAAACGSLQS